MSLGSKLAIAIVAALSVTTVAGAAMERGPKPKTKVEAEAASPLAEASDAVRGGDCKKAIPLLEQTVAGEPKNSEALNLLAYCQRKTGRLDEAFANYRRALEVRPEFPAAREYLGEAHVQAALQQVKILRSYGESARPELDKLVRALKEAAEAADDGAKPADAAAKDEPW